MSWDLWKRIKNKSSSVFSSSQIWGIWEMLQLCRASFLAFEYKKKKKLRDEQQEGNKAEAAQFIAL